MLREAYEKVRKNYGLPLFAELDAEFELAGIEEEDWPLRTVRRKIVEKLTGITEILEGIVFPREMGSQLYEAGLLSEDERREAFELHKTLMVHLRAADVASIAASDAHDAAFIKELLKEWKGLKQRLIGLLEALGQGWKKIEPKHERASYLW